MKQIFPEELLCAKHHEFTEVRCDAVPALKPLTNYRTEHPIQEHAGASETAHGGSPRLCVEDGGGMEEGEGVSWRRFFR